MLWVLKRPVPMRWFFEQPKLMFILMGKEINAILGAQTVLIWTYAACSQLKKNSVSAYKSMHGY